MANPYSFQTRIIGPNPKNSKLTYEEMDNNLLYLSQSTLEALDQIQNETLTAYATTGSNTFIGNQQIAGGVVVTGSLTVSGSSVMTLSATNINLTGSTANTGDFFVNDGAIVLASNGANLYTASIDGNDKLNISAAGSTTYLTLASTGDELTLRSAGAVNISGSTAFSGSVTVAGATTITGSLVASGSTNTFHNTLLFPGFTPSIAIGNNNTFTGTAGASIAIGTSNTLADGVVYGFAKGASNTIYAGGGTTFGESNTILAGALYSTAIGANNTVNGLYGTAVGQGSYVNAQTQFVVGKWNALSATTASFIVGNGLDTDNRRTLLEAGGTSVRISGSLIASGSSHTLSGSVAISGSLTVNGQAITAGGGSTIDTGSLGSTTITGSLTVSGSMILSGSSTTNMYDPGSALTSTISSGPFKYDHRLNARWNGGANNSSDGPYLMMDGSGSSFKSNQVYLYASNNTGLSMLNRDNGNLNSSFSLFEGVGSFVGGNKGNILISTPGVGSQYSASIRVNNAIKVIVGDTSTTMRSDLIVTGSLAASGSSHILSGSVGISGSLTLNGQAITVGSSINTSSLGPTRISSGSLTLTGSLLQQTTYGLFGSTKTNITNGTTHTVDLGAVYVGGDMTNGPLLDMQGGEYASILNYPITTIDLVTNSTTGLQANYSNYGVTSFAKIRETTGATVEANKGNIALTTAVGSQYSASIAGSVVVSGSITVSGSALLSLRPQHPLPAAASYPGAFAVSASTPIRPYFSDGTAWNILF